MRLLTCASVLIFIKIPSLHIYILMNSLFKTLIYLTIKRLKFIIYGQYNTCKCVNFESLNNIRITYIRKLYKIKIPYVQFEVYHFLNLV